MRHLSNRFLGQFHHCLRVGKVYAEVADRSTLWVASWDIHTNAAGHRMLADRLHALLLEQRLVPTETAGGGYPPPRFSPWSA